MNKAGQNTTNRHNKTTPQSVPSGGMWQQLKLRACSGDAEQLQKAASRPFVTHSLNKSSKRMGREVGRKGSLLFWDKHATY